MAPFVFSPLVKVALGAVGAATIVHWLVKEVRRINAELERMQAGPLMDPIARQALPTLRRDPVTGVYRVM
jgi:hypothetical protein